MVRDITIYGYISKGYTGQIVQVQCSIRNGFPGFDITGLPGSCVKEARERVRCALRSCDFKFPQSRVLINLSPASQPKDSTLLDLALACSIFVSQASANNPQRKYFDEEDIATVKVLVAGELTLTGDVLTAQHSLGAVQAARELGCQLCLLPLDNCCEFGVRPVRSLREAFSILLSVMDGHELDLEEDTSQSPPHSPIFSDIIGLESEKETLAMAASGFHSVLMFGPPGVGKTMLSNRLHMLLPPLEGESLKSVQRIRGCADLESRNLNRSRILGHDCTQTQFLSGSSAKLPGEGALAHCGTLVLDEVERFSPKLLQTIKDAYDQGQTQSSRSGEVLSYPARFLMVANMNPCPCGGLGNTKAICSCTSQKIDAHWRKVGRQMIERFDVRIPIKAQGDLMALALQDQKSDSYYEQRIAVSAERQRVRYKYIECVEYNGQVHYSTGALLKLRPEMEVLSKMEGQSSLSSRDQIGLVSLARTIADYDDVDVVTDEHFEKAKALRRYGLGDFYWRTLI